MWTPDLWRSWSLSVESASLGTWIPGEDVGTLKQVMDGDVVGYAHLTYDGEHITTPWGTASGNDARTVLRGGDVINSATRWAHGPGAVKNRNAHAARAEATTLVVNQAFITDRAESLVRHLQNVGINAFAGNITSRQGQVHAPLNDNSGSLTIALYPEGTLYVTAASGSPRALEVLAAAVDDWETQA